MRPWLLIGPAVLTLGLLFLWPIGLVVAQSFGHQAVGPGGLSLTYWAAVLHDPEFLAALALSLRVALVSTLLSMAVGLGLALLLHGSGKARLLARFPLVAPHLVAGYLTLLLLGQTGLLARIGHTLGLVAAPGQFPVLVNDAFGWGMVLAYLWKEAPFVALMVYPLLGPGADARAAAARTLGASPAQALRHVILPLTWPAVSAAGAIIFAYSFGAYELPMLLGRSYPRALPVLAFQRYVDPDLSRRPEAMALALVLTAVALGAAAWYLASLRRMERALACVRGDQDG